MKRMKRFTRYLFRKLWCSWRHRKDRCYPCDQIHWHCGWCHPCDEEIDVVFHGKKMGWL